MFLKVLMVLNKCLQTKLHTRLLLSKCSLMQFSDELILQKLPAQVAILFLIIHFVNLNL